MKDIMALRLRCVHLLIALIKADSKALLVMKINGKLLKLCMLQIKNCEKKLKRFIFHMFQFFGR